MPEKVQYSFAQPSLNLSVASSKGGNFSIGGAATGPEKPLPLIGADIGPDPRNAQATMHLPDHPDMVDEATGIRYDFLHGYRLEMPAGVGSYHVRVYDMDAEILLNEFTLQGGQFAIGERKYFIRYRITVEKNDELIFLHEFDCAGKKVMIIVPDGALGDNLAWMPYADAFREEHHAKVSCVCGEWLIRLVQKQYPDLEFIPVATQPWTRGYYACYCCAIFPKERKSWRPVDHQNFGMQGSVAKLLGVTTVPRKVRFNLDAPRPIAEPYVCISAMATNPAKHWNSPGGWNTLCRYLKRLGYRVFVIDRDKALNFLGKRYAVPEEAEDCTGVKPIADRLTMLHHAEFFVGLPSGLSWLAWSSGTPVVMLAGFTVEGAEFPTPYRVTNFNFCHGCWNDSNLFFDMTAPVWCPRHKGTPREIECTRAITPKMVIDTVNRIPGVAERLAAKKAATPEVSVIITSYHGEYLAATLDSIEQLLAKSKVPAEIILYDDASKSDRLQMQFARLEAIYPDLLHVIHGKENLGAARGRNEAVKHARGKYLLIFDDDDLMLPFDLRKSLDYLEAHPDTPLSYAPKYLFNAQQGFLKEIHGAPHSLLEAFFAPKVNINAALIRKSVWDALGGLRMTKGDPKEIGEDTDFIIRLGLTGPLHFEKEPRCLYRMHDRQLTAKPHQWIDEITQEPCNQHKELYERILKGDIPDVHGEDFRLVRGLMGTSFFFNQRDRKITEPMLKVAQKEFPEDFGSWDIWFYTLLQDGNVEEVRKALPGILKRFEDTPSIGILLFTPIFQYFKGQLPEDFQAMYRPIEQRFLELPDIVKEGFKRYGIRA